MSTVLFVLGSLSEVAEEIGIFYVEINIPMYWKVPLILAAHHIS